MQNVIKKLLFENPWLTANPIVGNGKIYLDSVTTKRCHGFSVENERGHVLCFAVVYSFCFFVYNDVRRKKKVTHTHTQHYTQSEWAVHIFSPWKFRVLLENVVKILIRVPAIVRVVNIMVMCSFANILYSSWPFVYVCVCVGCTVERNDSKKA